MESHYQKKKYTVLDGESKANKTNGRRWGKKKKPHLYIFASYRQGQSRALKLALSHTYMPVDISTDSLLIFSFSLYIYRVYRSVLLY